jgi:hypothetical protein
VCTGKCRCQECKNFEGSPDRNTLMLEHGLTLAPIVGLGGFASSSSSSSASAAIANMFIPGYHGGDNGNQIECVVDEDVQAADPPIESIQKIGDCLTDGAIQLVSRLLVLQRRIVVANVDQ